MAVNSDLSKGVSKFIADITKGLNGKLKDQISEAAATTAAELIRRRTRSGKGVAEDFGTEYPLKKLSAKYIEQRKRSSLSSYTSPTKSNLTFKGDMLGSLTAQRRKPGSWVILLYGTHWSGKSNSDIARYVQKARPFMNISGGEAAKIKEVARKKFEQLVKSEIKR